MRAAWSAVADVRSGARIDLGGELFLGHWPTGPPPVGRTRLRLGRGSSLTTSGWVVLASGVYLNAAANASVHLGGGTYVSLSSRLLVEQELWIGRDCAISWDVLITDSDYHYLEVRGEPRSMTAPIRLGDRVWVGARAVILKGVTIGAGTVVAAGAVVTRSVPDRSLVAGTPARVIRTDVTWE